MDNLISLYQQRLNLQDAIFARIEHEDATVAIVYKITLSNGKELILKICPRPQDYVREVYFLQKFAGMIPVPSIIKVIEPEVGIAGAILMECLSGTLLKPIDITEILAYQIGAVLAQIHMQAASGYGDLTNSNDLVQDPRIHFVQAFNEALDECSNHLPQELIAQCRTYFDAHFDLLAAVDGPCIVHRDFRPGNIIVHDGTLQGIIDWSSARAGFAQEDFCLLEHDAGWQIDAVLKKALLAGYASVRPIPDYNIMLPLLRLNRAIAIIGFTVKRGTWHTSSARVYDYNRQFLDDFFLKFKSR